MPPALEPQRVTELLNAYRDGDASAGERLFAALYDDLHVHAAQLMARERSGHTLQPTALVNEAWLRLKDVGGLGVQDRGHFLRIAARAMRRVLVDHARRRAVARRAGRPVPLESDRLVAAYEGPSQLDVLALDDALETLRSRDADAAQLVELRYFAGLTFEETAAALGITRRQVEWGWTFARGWLRRELERGGGNAE
ncbi:MAG: ECF-type sigma factor [Planctomycetota bacterium]